MKNKTMKLCFTKTMLILFCVFGSTVTVIAQNKKFTLNENICYCAGNSPSSILKMDNNWELALLLRNSLKKKQIDSLGLSYISSQLKLLESWGIIDYKRDKTYQTSIQILDSLKSNKLRSLSEKKSLKLADIIAPKVIELKSYLEKIGRGKNVYSIIFSYVIDGMIWDSLEENNLIKKRDLDANKPFWSGEFWTLDSKRNFYCGTNSISDKGYSLNVNWSEKAIPKMLPFVTRFDLQSKIIDDFIEKGKITNQEVKDVFSEFNFF